MWTWSGRLVMPTGWRGCGEVQMNQPGKAADSKRVVPSAGLSRR